jgi:hypothetical protein
VVIASILLFVLFGQLAQLIRGPSQGSPARAGRGKLMSTADGPQTLGDRSGG